MIGALIIQIVLIFINAVFASAEIAVISMNDAKLKKLTQEGDTRAKKLGWLTEQPAKFLSTIQVAITLAGLLGGAFAAENFASPLVDALLSTGLPIHRSVLHSIVVFLITLVLTYFQIVFGELVPKRLAMKKCEPMALGMAGFLFYVSKITTPLVWLLTVSTNFVLRLMKIDPNEEEEIVTEEEIRMMLAEGNQQGTIQVEESEMIQNVFELNDTFVDEVCTHRRDVAFLYLEDSEEDWAKTIQESRFTYYPICDKNQDDIVGILDTKDYFRSENRSKDYVMENAVNRPFFVPETMRINVLFARMKQMRTYFAVVLDEYGATSGIVTLHDLVEALVGDLDDEEEPLKPDDIEMIKEGVWRIAGSADLEEVNEELHIKLPDEDYDTFSGFVWGEINRVPADGESFSLEACGLKIEVKNVKNHMVDYALVRKLPKPQKTEPETETAGTEQQ